MNDDLIERCAMTERYESRETVEALLAEHRKQVLLEVVDRLPLKTVGIYDGDYQTGTKDGWNDAVDEFRRMAEGEK